MLSPLLPRVYFPSRRRWWGHVQRPGGLRLRFLTAPITNSRRPVVRVLAIPTFPNSTPGILDLQLDS